VSISRSIATRLLEGMRLLLVSDADIADPTKFRGGVHVGPLVPDATDGDPIIAPRQINLMFAPNLVIDQFFSSHAGQATIPVIIAFYAPYSKEAINVSTGVNEYDYFEHIQKVLANGTEGAGNGKIVNPDDPTNPSASSEVSERRRADIPHDADGRRGQLRETGKHRALLRGHRRVRNAGRHRHERKSMSDTKRIRYNGKGGAVVQNQFGVWDASRRKFRESPYSRDKDVPSAYADRMVGEGQYEEVKPELTPEQKAASADKAAAEAAAKAVEQQNTAPDPES
jgi:hypothetical protein